MSRVAIEFPIAEAQALRRRLAGEYLTLGEELNATKGAIRLDQAVAVELGSGGSAERRPVNAAASS